MLCKEIPEDRSFKTDILFKPDIPFDIQDIVSAVIAMKIAVLTAMKTLMTTAVTTSATARLALTPTSNGAAVEITGVT